VSLLGSREFDTGKLQSAFGYVFDHATPIGEIVLASPTHYRIVAELRGRAVHAGIEPEAGRSAIAAAASAIAAMRLGRLDDETTANVGTIQGGSAINVVPERCRIEAETRSLDADRAAAVCTEMVDHLQDAANAHECDLDVTVERMFEGYRTRPKATPVQIAERALRACGYEPTHIVTGGASDANSFEKAGFSCVNLANGTEKAHQIDERVSVEALEGMYEVAIALVDEAARGENGGETHNDPHPIGGAP
jgi:tripeptide aminopeptidase